MEMLSMHLERNGEKPLYEQLYTYIKKEIIAGNITYGTKLPSKRKLAEFLDISKHTVETAYEQLLAEGYIESVPRKGYFVLAREDLEYMERKPFKPVEESEEKEEDAVLYDFHPGRIDTENFPFEQWRKYTNKIIARENRHLLLIGDHRGEYELRKEICRYLFQARGVHCRPEQIVVGAGMETLLQQLIMLFDKNTVYGVEDPGYHVISQLLKKYGADIYPLAVDEEGVNADEINKTNVDVVYVTPSHHFPYGSILPVNRRAKLLQWAAESDNRYIIEDDYDSEFRYSGKTIPSLQSMDQKQKVIYLGTFSKSFVPSIRISYMVLPEKLLRKFRKELAFYQCSVSRIDQAVLTEFMREGEFEKHLNRMRKVYRRKLKKVLEFLKPYEKELGVISTYSGFYIVLVVRNGMNGEELVKKAMDYNLKVYPVSSYRIAKKKERFPEIVLGFAGIPEEELGKALSLLLTSWGIL